MNEKLRSSTVKVRVRKILAAAATASAVLLALTLGAAPASATPTSGDPLSTGCASSASTIWSNNYLGYGTVEVRYSSSCGTNWVRITGADGRPAEAGIYSVASGWQYSPSYFSSPSSFWTPMVYAPGANCITFYAKITAYGGATLNTGNLQLC